MNKIYKNQSALQIKLTTNVDLSTVASAVIKYKKPDGVTTGEWDAQLEEGTTNITYNVLDSTVLDVAGTWTVWSYLTFDDGREAPGEPVSLYIFEEGTM